jgi:hypothetical protein
MTQNRLNIMNSHCENIEPERVQMEVAKTSRHQHDS